jgi:hypothetical protein
LERRVSADDTITCLGDLAHPDAWRGARLMLDVAECPGEAAWCQAITTATSVQPTPSPEKWVAAPSFRQRPRRVEVGVGR